jgi:hypothetical protein
VRGRDGQSLSRAVHLLGWTISVVAFNQLVLQTCGMNICPLVHPLQIISAILALVAAGLWILASITPTISPKEFTQDRLEEYNNVVRSLRRQTQVLAKQSRLNAFAAFFAALAAIGQFTLAFFPTCWG